MLIEEEGKILHELNFSFVKLGPPIICQIFLGTLSTISHSIVGSNGPYLLSGSNHKIVQDRTSTPIYNQSEWGAESIHMILAICAKRYSPNTVVVILGDTISTYPDVGEIMEKYMYTVLFAKCTCYNICPFFIQLSPSVFVWTVRHLATLCTPWYAKIG